MRRKPSAFNSKKIATECHDPVHGILCVHDQQVAGFNIIGPDTVNRARAL
ncbi:MAG TPA: hypothetical protein VF456_29590 [Vicinamibacterales bacterium]